MQSLPSFPCTLRNLLVPTQLLIGFDREVNCWSFRSPESAALPRRPGLPPREGGGGGPLRQHPRRARQVRGQRGEATSQAGWVNIALLTEVNSREGERGYKVEAMKQQIRYFGNKMLVVFYVLLRLVIQWHHLRSKIEIIAIWTLGNPSLLWSECLLQWFSFVTTQNVSNNKYIYIPQTEELHLPAHHLTQYLTPRPIPSAEICQTNCCRQNANWVDGLISKHIKWFN